MEKHRILIIEDNPDTLKFLEVMLKNHYDVVTAENGVIGVDHARNKSPALILLDIMLPVLNGYDTCSLLKKDNKTKNIPIIFLSAKNSVQDITEGLKLGADDYIPKPFEYKELLARIETRITRNQETLNQPVVIGDLKIDMASRKVFYGDSITNLTVTEFDILRHLAIKAGNIISREEIIKEIWDNQNKKTNDRTIDVHIRAIRKKIPEISKHIISIYGVGYKYEK